MVNGEVLTKEQVDDIRRTLRGASGGRSFARPDRVAADLLATLDAVTVVVDQARNVDRRESRTALVDETIEECIEWMREHLSGISAPNERDFDDMRAWLAARRANVGG